MHAVESRGGTILEISGSVPMIGIQSLAREGRRPNSFPYVKKHFVPLRGAAELGPEVWLVNSCSFFETGGDYEIK